MRRSSLWLAVSVLVTLSACKREPTFDERYTNAQKAIREKAGELDQDMAKRATEAKETAPSASASTAAAVSGET